MTQHYLVDAIPAFNDNYIWAIRKNDNNHCVVVDPGSANEVINYLHQHKLVLAAILITHHHKDHTGGVAELISLFPNTIVYGPAKEAQNVVHHSLKQDDVVSIAALDISLNVIDVPGHTLGHIAYWDRHSLFCGDTLFSGGCGRMFEGDAIMFSNSLAKLAQLAPATKVYCAHEYTLSNLTFAKAVTPNCTKLDAYITACALKRQTNKPTIPSDIGTELAINPFLRLNDKQLVESLNHQFALSLTTNTNLDQNFKWLRHWKDTF